MGREDRSDLTKQRKTLERGLRKLKFSHVRPDIFRRELRRLELHSGRIRNEQSKCEVILSYDLEHTLTKIRPVTKRPSAVYL